MKLEDEIQQKEFKNTRQRLLINLLFTSGWINHIQCSNLRQFGISIQQYNLLRILRGQYPNPVTVNLLKERMLDKMSNASRLVERLRKAELVQRAVNDLDRRAVDVVITPKGLALLEQLDETESKWVGLTNHLEETEIDLLNHLLDKLRDAKVPA